MAVSSTDRLLKAIIEVQDLIIHTEPATTVVFEAMLAKVVELTGSAFGFAGEVLSSADGIPYLKTHALTNIAWNEETRVLHEKHLSMGLEFHNLNTLFGAALKSGEPVISNDPVHDERSGGLPSGHPALFSFLCLPIKDVDKMVGMLGLANKPGGYEPADIRFLQPLLRFYASMISFFRDKMEFGQVAAELRINRDAWEALFESSSNSVMLLTRDHRILRANQATYEKLGLLDETLVGRKCYDIFHNTAAPPANCPMEQMSRNGQYHIVREMKVECLANTFMVSCTPLFNKQGHIERILHVATDITQLKKAEKRAEASETKFRGYFDHSSVGMALVGLDGRILECNVALAKLLGYSQEDLGAKTIDEITHPDDRSTQKDHKTKQAGDGNKSFLMKKRFLCADGSIVLGLLTVTLLHDDSGAPVSFLNQVVDITEQEQTQKIQQTLLLTRTAILEYAISHPKNDLLTFVLDRIGELVDSPIGFYHFVGEDEKTLSLQAWSSRTLKEFCRTEGRFLHYPVEQAGVWADPLRLRRPVIHNDYESMGLRKGMPPGHARVVRELVVPVFRKDRIVAILGVGNKPTDYTEKDVEIVNYLADVTWGAIEQKQSEQQVLRLQTAIQQVNEAIVMTDSQGVINYINDAFTTMTGYHAEEAIGQTPAILKSGRQDEDFYQEMWATIISGEIYRGRLVNRRKDGSMYTEEMTISPVKNTTGEIVNFVAIKKDITEHLAMSKRLNQAQKMEAIGTLAGGIAHDFNNILSAIIGYGELAQIEIDNPSKAKEDLEQVLIAAERATELVRQVLLFARQTEQKRQPIRVQFLVKEALKLLRPTISSNFKIETDIDMDTPEILADPGEINQVIMNLCVNANHAMEALQSGNHCLRINLDAVDLGDEEIQDLAITSKARHFVRLIVSDTGCGMNEETSKKIFEPYFTTKAKGKGTGLGLATVQSIIYQLGGGISVKSSPNAGSKFTVYLPVHATDHSSQSPTERAAVRGGTERIMVIDDEKPIADLLLRQLHAVGYRVSAYTDGQEAMQAFMTNPSHYDLVITDMNMPKVLGVTLASNILKFRPDLPIILCTGFREKDDLEKAKAIGITDLLHKPVEKDKLLTTVRKLLDKGDVKKKDGKG